MYSTTGNISANATAVKTTTTCNITAYAQKTEEKRSINTSMSCFRTS